MYQLLKGGTDPEWLAQGQMVLIMKDQHRRTILFNYWQITCLCTTWKLLLSIIAARLSRHVAQYMSRAQKGVGSDTRGDKHQLLVDRAVVRNSKTRMTNLCTAWIENKKAEDSPVKQISRTAFFHHSNIAKIRHILFHPAKLVNLFFTSRLDYCNFGGFLFFYDLGI